jgi:pantoate--beta-alanine ligase
LKLIRTTTQLKHHINRIKASHRTIGFVPTMGALHDGHLSLITASLRRCDATVVSIFVNPTQFGPGEDYRRYPRTLGRDAELCRKAGVHLLFVPPVNEVSPLWPSGGRMRPPGDLIQVDAGALGHVLEGAARPGHFNGVATVVLQLLNLVQPDHLFLGRKDYQQTLVIKQLVDSFHLAVDVIVCPTIREADGLAMSSRNRYLTRPQRHAATLISQALRAGHTRLRTGERSPAVLRLAMRRVLARSPLIRVEYLAVCDPNTLDPLTQVHRRAVLAIAARIGKTRLIDNIVFDAG